MTERNAQPNLARPGFTSPADADSAARRSAITITARTDLTASSPGHPAQPRSRLLVRAELPATPHAARQARDRLRQALEDNGLAALASDAELLASELVANAAEHATGKPIRLVLRQHATHDGRAVITCEVSDTSPALPKPRPATSGSERGRGLAIIDALATDHGVRADLTGKTCWFTLTTPATSEPAARQAWAESEPEPPRPKGNAMTTPQTPRDRENALSKARQAARNAAFTLARDAGAQIITRPLFHDSDLTTTDLEPTTGMRAARDLELGARHATLGYIRQAREAGRTWHDIGLALGVIPGGDAQQAGQTIAEAAYTYAAGHPDTETARRYGRSYGWTCQSCNQAISDHGLISGPADDEHGHAGNCPRLAAAIARWDAQWEAEP